MKKIILTIISLMIVIALCSCGTTTESDTTITTTKQPITTETFLELDTYSLSLVVGDTYTFVVSGNNGDVSWSSSDSSIVTIENGLLTAIKEGNAVITASDSKDSVTCNVKVSDDLKEGVNFYLNREISSIYIGYEKQLTPMLIKGSTQLNPSDYNLTFTSSKPSVVSVSSIGLIKGLAVGEATIEVTVTVDGIEYKSSTNVEVKTLDSIELNDSEILLSKSGTANTKQLKPKYLRLVNGAYQEADVVFNYNSLNENIVTVNENGLLTGISAGTALVNISANGLSINVSIKVFDYYKEIYTPYDFLDIDSHMDGLFELKNDIDFTGITFKPFGLGDSVENSTIFNGVLNGNGYKVSNITHELNDYRSIFVYLGESGVIKNIEFENVNLLNSRASRSAGLVWNNYGTIKNIKISVNTNGTGTSVNEWGFGGIVSSNNSTGTVENCIVVLNDSSQSTYTGAIYNVNRGGSIINNVALANKSGIQPYTHTGSFGSAYNNNVVLNVEDALTYIQSSQFDSSVWVHSRINLPSLYNEGAVIKTYSVERLISSTDNLNIPLKANRAFYYDASYNRVEMSFTTINNSTTITGSNLPTIKANENYLYVLAEEDESSILYSVKVIGITALITNETGFRNITNDPSGYYVLSNDISFSSEISENYLVQNFSGVLDGKGYKISYSYPNTHYHTLFESVTAVASIRNVYFDLNGGSASGNKAGFAAISKTNYGLIENCVIDAEYLNVGQQINDEGTFTKSGVVLRNYGTINNCIVVVNYTGTTDISSTTSIYAICATNNGTILNVGVLAMTPNSTVQMEAIGRHYNPIEENIITSNNKESFINSLSTLQANGFSVDAYFVINESSIKFGDLVIISN